MNLMLICYLIIIIKDIMEDDDCGSKQEQLECTANLNEPEPDEEAPLRVSRHIKKSKDLRSAVPPAPVEQATPNPNEPELQMHQSTPQQI